MPARVAVLQDLLFLPCCFVLKTHHGGEAAMDVRIPVHPPRPNSCSASEQPLLCREPPALLQPYRATLCSMRYGHQRTPKALRMSRECCTLLGASISFHAPLPKEHHIVSHQSYGGWRTGAGPRVELVIQQPVTAWLVWCSCGTEHYV